METTLKFDRVVLIKELNEKFSKVGEAFEIANVLDNSFLLRDTKTRVAIGVVSFEDFEKCFVHESNFSGWTKWCPLTGFDGQTDACYRTNRRKVQVKFITDNVRAESSRHKDNEFNLFFGVQMAYLRCLNKAWEKKKNEYELKKNECELKLKEYEASLKRANAEIVDNERIIQKMINSLEV